MKTYLKITFLCLMSLMPAAGRAGGQLHLLSTEYLFDRSVTPAITMPEGVGKGSINMPAVNDSGFTIQMNVSLTPFSGQRQVLQIDSLIDITLRQHQPADRLTQNYPAFPMADGTVPVLEARIRLQLPTKEAPTQWMTVGVPLAELPRAWGEHTLTLSFTGVAWTMYVDGRLADNDFALGYPNVSGRLQWTRDVQTASDIRLFLPALKATRDTAKDGQHHTDVQYFTPQWHNAWVGDVATCWHQGRYHVFYLFDRRGHQSKFGRGGHYFEHFSTTDFIHWTGHEAATPVEHQWECIGTGTPFEYDGKLCLSYGLHTTRIYPKEQTAQPAQWDYIRQHGETACMAIDTLTTVPAGATYSVSTDGIARFSKSGKLIHPCENPTIFTDDQGNLQMLANYGARGTWTSSRLDGGWRCISEDFPPGGDCTFIFSWGDYDYIVGGFSHQWGKRHDEPISAYRDMTAEGRDLYNGFNVPAISRVADGRYLMAGWVHINDHWGGVFAIHELVQKPDGRIGSKWMPELVPATGRTKRLARRADSPTSHSTDSDAFILSFDVVPAPQARPCIQLLPQGDAANACEWSLDINSGRAQFSPLKDGRATPQKTLSEGGDPARAVDYAIGHLDIGSSPFHVRMLVKHTAKLGGTLIDVEIAGERTMFSYRHQFKASQIRLVPGGASLRNVTVSAVKTEGE